jgi:hypothetical protein
LPPTLSGTASDLFETYGSAGLQFIIGRRVIRYGRARSGESVPDGIAIAGLNYALFDAKAASGGFKFDAETIRQFSRYVRDFSKRYENLGKPIAFICISGGFLDSPESLEARSRELYADCGTVLVVLSVPELVAAVRIFREDLQLRQFADWRKILTNTVLTTAQIEQHLRSAARDRLAEEI